MNKIILSLCLAFIIKSNAQLTLGAVTVDPYVGYPNLANIFLYNQPSSVYELDNGEQVYANNFHTKGSMLSYGARVEYMYSDKLGLGGDLNYEMSGYSFEFQGKQYDEFGSPLLDASGSNYLYTKYLVNYRANRLRVMFRLNYHFYQANKTDAYVGFSVGHKSVTRRQDTNPTNLLFHDFESDGLIPFTSRLAVGFKYYPIPYFGFHGEFGLFGGALFQAGVSIQIPK